jgi:hypothetical protein
MTLQTKQRIERQATLTIIINNIAAIAMAAIVVIAAILN